MKYMLESAKIKKALFLITAIIIIVFLSGCTKCVSTETKTVQVKVTDEYHHGAWVQPILIGKTHSSIYHSATYRITVEYENIEYDIYGRDTYDKYSSRIGQYVNGVLQIKKYDDGSLRYDIINLE
mgnify:CR=1 FL=1